MVDWYEDFAASIDDGSPTFLRCQECQAATVPPRSRCPDCGGGTLERRPLSTRATVVAATRIHVSTPEFVDETPYTVVLATFDEGIRLTGQLRGAEGVERAAPVELGTEAVSEDHRIITFTPV